MCVFVCNHHQHHVNNNNKNKNNNMKEWIELDCHPTRPTAYIPIGSYRIEWETFYATTTNIVDILCMFPYHMPNDLITTPWLYTTLIRHTCADAAVVAIDRCIHAADDDAWWWWCRWLSNVWILNHPLLSRTHTHTLWSLFTLSTGFFWLIQIRVVA